MKKREELRAYRTQWNKDHPEEAREHWRKAQRKRQENFPEKIRELRRKSYQKNPQQSLKLKKRYWRDEETKLKAQARNKANYKISISGACQICKINPATEKHHPDYSKPMEVILVCDQCHGLQHRIYA